MYFVFVLKALWEKSRTLFLGTLESQICFDESTEEGVLSSTLGLVRIFSTTSSKRRNLLKRPDGLLKIKLVLIFQTVFTNQFGQSAKAYRVHN